MPCPIPSGLLSAVCYIECHAKDPIVQPSQLVGSLRDLVALHNTSESLLGDLNSQDFPLTNEDLDAFKASIKGKRIQRIYRRQPAVPGRDLPHSHSHIMYGN